MEAGINHVAAIFPGPETGWRLSGSDRVASLLQKVGPAERVGLDEVNIGRHRRTEFLEARAVAVQ